MFSAESYALRRNVVFRKNVLLAKVMQRMWETSANKFNATIAFLIDTEAAASFYY